MLLIDGHLDLAMNALLWNRDLRKSVAETREDEAGMPQKGRAAGTTAYPEMRAGEIAISLATVIARVQQPGSDVTGYRTHEIAYGQAQGQLAYYRELERQGVLRMLRDWPAVEAHLAQWKSDPQDTPLGFVLCMEGADPIVEPCQVDSWWNDGLRIVSLAHYGPSAYAKGTGVTGPLTPEGRTLLVEMERAGMILDATHLSDESFYEAVDLFGGTILASHSNCRALVDGDRQLTDDMLKLLFARDAVVGAVMDAWMLEPGWIKSETTNERVSLDTVVDHIDHVCQLAGNARHAAIGTDLDGGYGTEQCPNDVDTITDVQTIADLLARRGYASTDIEAIMHGNWLRLLRRAWSGTSSS
ncbi:membrane dipeptidase [soil metagenome]